MADTSISWCDKVWNPVVGCSRVSAGCEHCYAERMAHRGMSPQHRGLTVMGKHGPRWTGEARFIPERLSAPLHWRKPARIFVNSMSDLFHNDVTNEQIAAVFGAMAACPQHTFMVLTKRPDRMCTWFEWLSNHRDENGAYPSHRDTCRDHLERYYPCVPYDTELEWPLPNVWLGVSVESQDSVHRIEKLLAIPAAVRFVSLEPLLGPVDISHHLKTWRIIHMRMDIAGAIRNKSFRGFTDDNGSDVHPRAAEAELRERLAKGEKFFPMCKCPDFDPQTGCPEKLTPALDWVIVGCESGPKRRPCNLEWIRSIAEQTKSAGRALFVKQLEVNGRVSTNPAEWPSWSRIQEFPR